MEVNPLLKAYIPLVDYIGQFFGSNCEVILHDLSNLEHSIIAIANSELTGRRVGGHITDFGLEILHAPAYQDEPFVVNYPGATPDGTRQLKCATYFIRDDSNQIIGLLCFNFDITDLTQAQNLISGLIQMTPHNSTAVPTIPPLVKEWFSPSMDDTLSHSISKVLSSFALPAKRLTAEEKKQALEQLHNLGIFTLKGAVGMVATQMEVSEQTIYRYLRELQLTLKHG